MAAEYAEVFEALRRILARHQDGLAVKVDTPVEYTLVTRYPSPFPQHKGEPLYFGSVRLGKAYVSYHLMPLYMCAALLRDISPALKKRMQGKTCFNFKTLPDAELANDVALLTGAAVKANTAMVENAAKAAIGPCKELRSGGIPNA